MLLGTGLVTWSRVGLLLAASSVLWLVWYGWWSARQSGAVYSIVGAQLFSTAQIVLVELILGLLGVLYTEVILATNLAIAGLIFFLGVWPHRSKIISSRRALRETWRANRKSIAVVFLVALFLGITVWNLFWGWFLPPREWDTVNYHLTIMAAFYQSHSIFPIPSPIYWIQSYPFNGELMQLWVLASVGVDKVVDWAFVPSIVAGALAVYGLARRLGVKPLAAVLGASVMAFAPRMLLQQVDMMNDALFASLIAMGIFMILGVPASEGEDRARQLRLSAFGAAVSAGLVAGIKFAGIVYALGLFVLFLIKWFSPRPKSSQPVDPRWNRAVWSRTVLPSLFLFLGLCLYPYFRNLIRDGNPVAPYNVQIDGIVFFQGNRQISEFSESNTVSVEQSMGVVERTLYGWFEPYQSVHDFALGGLGALWIIIAVPAVLAWVILSLRRRRGLELVLILVVLIAVAATPAFWYPRYALPLLILGGVATARVFGELGRWPGRLIVMEIVFFSLFSVFNSLAPKSVSWQDARDVLLAQDDRTRSGPQFINPNYGRDAYQWIDQFTMDHPTTITYGENIYFPYLLYGQDIRNQVIHLLPASEEDWRASLEQSRVELILVRDDMPTYNWTEKLTTFREVFRDGQYVVFERIH